MKNKIRHPTVDSKRMRKEDQREFKVNYLLWALAIAMKKAKNE